jgi:hypothetical protein
MAGFELKAKLLLNRGEDAGRLRGVGRAVEHRRRGVVRRPPQAEVVAAAEASLVQHHATQHLRQLAREDAHGVAAARDG